MKKLTHILSIILIICWVTITVASPATGLSYLASQQTTTGLIGGLTETGWAVMALGAYGQHNARALAVLEQEQHSLSEQATTAIERQILALVAAGQNPRTFGGVNAITVLNSRLTNNQFGSPDFLNDDIFGLLALRAADQPLPGGVIQNLVSHQQSNGGWGLTVSGAASSDMTAVALIALRGTGVAPEVIAKGQAYLQSLQNSDGGFATQSGASSVGSTTWVRWFMNSYGQNWQKDGHTADDFIVSQQSSNGSWLESVLLTSYSLIALSHKAFPIIGVVQPTPTPTVSVTPSPSPSPSLSPSPTPTPTVTPTITPTPSPSPSLTPTPTPSVTPTATPSATPSLSPSATPTLVQPTPTPSPKAAVVRVTYVTPKPQKQSYITPQVQRATPASSPTLNVIEHHNELNSPTPSPTLSASLSPEPVAPSQSDPLTMHIAFGGVILGLNIAATAYDFAAARKKQRHRL